MCENASLSARGRDVNRLSSKHWGHREHWDHDSTVTICAPVPTPIAKLIAIPAAAADPVGRDTNVELLVLVKHVLIFEAEEENCTREVEELVEEGGNG